MPKLPDDQSHDVDAEALAVIVMGTTRMLALSTRQARGKQEEARVVKEALVLLLSPATRAAL